jgi:hypothetical protein
VEEEMTKERIHKFADYAIENKEVVFEIGKYCIVYITDKIKDPDIDFYVYTTSLDLDGDTHNRIQRIVDPNLSGAEAHIKEMKERKHG